MILDSRVVVTTIVAWCVAGGLLFYFAGIPSTFIVVLFIMCIPVVPVLDAIFAPPESDLYWRQ